MRVIICLILISMITLCGCNNLTYSIENDDVDTSTNNLVESDSEAKSSIQKIANIQYGFDPLNQTDVITICDEELNGASVIHTEGEIAERILSILNNGKWVSGNTKTYSDVEFSIDGAAEVYYSTESGLFNDKANQRNLKLTDEDKSFINSLIFKENSLSASSISVIKEFSDQSLTLETDRLQAFLESFDQPATWRGWRAGIAQANYDLCFVLDDNRKIYYSSEAGVFKDEENNLRFVATTAQGDLIDSIINSFQNS